MRTPAPLGLEAGAADCIGIAQPCAVGRRGAYIRALVPVLGTYIDGVLSAMRCWKCMLVLSASGHSTAELGSASPFRGDCIACEIVRHCLAPLFLATGTDCEHALLVVVYTMANQCTRGPRVIRLSWLVQLTAHRPALLATRPSSMQAQTQPSRTRTTQIPEPQRGFSLFQYTRVLGQVHHGIRRHH